MAHEAGGVRAGFGRYRSRYSNENVRQWREAGLAGTRRRRGGRSLNIKVGMERVTCTRRALRRFDRKTTRDVNNGNRSSWVPFPHRQFREFHYEPRPGWLTGWLACLLACSLLTSLLLSRLPPPPRLSLPLFLCRSFPREIHESPSGLRHQ